MIPRRSWTGGWLLLALAGPASAEMAVDGRLDEPDWAQAMILSEFRTTEPYTQAAPELATEVRILSRPDGLYIGFACDQPPAIARSRTIGQRDQTVPGDRVGALIDFDGSGTTAYEFSVYLGGARRDAIISRQTRYNYDWDGDWDYAVSETKDRWFAELRIPWSTAPLGEAKNGQRTIGVFATRIVVQSGRRYSQPGHEFSRATFVADMNKLQVDAHSRAQLDLFPYAAASHDVLAGETEGRGGLDMLWKPNGQHQVAATINPDFGQVESDQLVVNFSAIPTFFPDKRPFFTENFDLFSTDFNILYTRRVGARPDAGDEGASDILGAAKYTGSRGGLQFGTIAASEDDSSAAQGRDFFVGRARYKLSDAFSLGMMGTHVDRPTIDRQADVAALDFGWTLGPGVRLSGQGAVSEIDAKPTGTFADFLDPVGHGSGGRMLFSYAPGGSLDSSTVFITKNPGFNINDAGYQSRPNDHLVETVNTWYWRDWPASSAFEVQNLETLLNLAYNDSGEQRPGFFRAVWNLKRRDTRTLGLQYQGDYIGGEDDLLTQGNGNVKLPMTHRIDAYYQSLQTGLFRYYTQIGVGSSSYRDRGFHLFYLQPGFYPSDRFSITSTLEFWNYADYAIWDPVNSQVGLYEYEQQYASLDVNWFPLPRHEIRVKFQWVAASGGALGAYLPGVNGTLQATGAPIEDFSFTTTALQARYKFEIAPQSELFLVYSRAGFEAQADTERHQLAALRRGLAEETASQFLLKLRYRFSLLD